MNARTLIPLMAAQEGVWIGQLLDPESAAYVTAESVELRGPIELSVLSFAVSQALREAHGLAARVVVRSHRPSFELDGGLSVEPVLVDVPDHAAAASWMERDVGVRFDLERGPLARQALLRVSDEHVYWYLAAHHLALDGYAFSLIIQRAAELYRARVQGAPHSESPFVALLEAARDDLAYGASPEHLRDRAFWCERLRDMPEPVCLGGSVPKSPRTPRRTLRELDAAALKALDLSLGRRGPSWVHVLSALFAAYVEERAGSEGVVLGLPVLARMGRSALRCPIMMMNIVPLWLPLTGTRSAREGAELVSRELSLILPHSRYRYEQLRRDLGRLGGDKRLFGPVLNVMPFPRAPMFGAVSGVTRGVSAGPVEDLSVSVHPLAARAGLQLTFDAHPEAYAPDALTRLADGFCAFVLEHASDPDRAWRARTAAAGAASDVVLRGDVLEANARDVLAAIVEHATRDGERIAIQEPGRSVSYRELVSKAQGLATRMAAQGVLPGSRVALSLSRSADAVVAMLATLLCDAAYVPLDPEGPKERSAAILRDACVELVLVGASAVASSELAGRRVLSVHDAAAQHTLLALREDPPETPAYVIYTSGSTGEPSGVVIGRAALAHFVAAARQRYGIVKDDRVLQFAPLAFDASVEEIFVTLVSGARLVLRDPSMLESATHFLRRSAELELTVLDLPTAFFHELTYALAHGELPFPSAVRTVIIGGEAALSARVRAFHDATRGEVRLLNTYGPTETTVVATASDLSLLEVASLGEEPPIGRPLPGLSAILRPLAGAETDELTYELFLSGPTLAEGYLGRAELTRQRFFELCAHGRVYRTGDVVRLRDDGQLAFVGRRDDQLKISGHRVELPEIERTLQRHPEVRDAVVVATARGAQRRLVAHVVPSSAALTLGLLRDHAKEHLLAAAVPSAFVLHDALPKTATGKIDRKLLSGLAPAAERVHDEKASELELLILEVWREVLGLESIGLEQDFFELGGQSLQTIQVATRLGLCLRREIAGVVLFQNPTIRALARALTSPVAERQCSAEELRARVLADAELGEAGRIFASPADASAGSVLLTGATGFLGVQLLRELLARTEYTVVCLVRADDERTATARLVDALEARGLLRALISARVRVVAGDLRKPQLGLDATVYTRLAADCALVVHNGASVSLARGYASLRGVNVSATREVIRFAARAHGAPIHYVSTLATALGAAAGGRLEERFVAYHAGLQDGYSQSKWASERLLEQASARGLRVKVYRLGRLVSALDGGVVNRDDLIWRMIAAGLRAGALPRLGVREPWTPVDVTARVIVAAAFDGEVQGPVFHLAPATMLSLDDVMRWTISYGYRARVCTPADYLTQIARSESDTDPATLALFDAQAQRKVEQIAQIDAANATHVMKRAGIVWPAIGQIELHRALSACVEAGLIPAPPAQSAVRTA